MLSRWSRWRTLAEDTDSTNDMRDKIDEMLPVSREALMRVGRHMHAHAYHYVCALKPCSEDI
jgi:hypothetical protein